MKRLTALAFLAALLVAAPLAFARTHSQAATTVKVVAKEFKFTLSRKTAPHGTVVFKLVNKGHIAHDFKIAGKKTPRIKPGKTATLKVTLTKGPHKYVCTVPGHAAAGMKGTFKAT
jgi:nitrite reductase (NO-forming)